MLGGGPNPSAATPRREYPEEKDGTPEGGEGVGSGFLFEEGSGGRPKESKENEETGTEARGGLGDLAGRRRLGWSGRWRW